MECSSRLDSELRKAPVLPAVPETPIQKLEKELNKLANLENVINVSRTKLEGKKIEAHSEIEAAQKNAKLTAADQKKIQEESHEQIKEIEDLEHEYGLFIAKLKAEGVKGNAIKQELGAQEELSEKDKEKLIGATLSLHDLEKTANKLMNKTAQVLYKLGLRQKESTDMCFVLDVTGSMGAYIEPSKQFIKKIIAQIKEKYQEFTFRVAFVAYRDVQDTPRFEIQPFTDDIPKMNQFIDNLRASGGGDTPEDINGALQKAVNELEWCKTNRLVFHIADAPCHNRIYHDADDNHPNGYKDDMPYEVLFERMVAEQISYTFVQVSNLTDKMSRAFGQIFEKARKAAGSMRSNYMVMDAINSAGADRFEAIYQGLFQSLTNTFSGTFSATDNQARVPAGPPVDWKGKWERHEVEIAFVDLDETAVGKILNAKSELVYKRYKKTLWVNPISFGKDEDATYHYAKETEDGSGKRFVVNINHPGRMCESEVEIRKCALAQKVARKFNAELVERGLPRTNALYFCDIGKLVLHGRPSLIHSFIDADYDRYSDSCEYVNGNAKLMGAFTHYSYQSSDEMFLVNRLQGVNKLLIDPSVASRNLVFRDLKDEYDHGIEGVIAFFRGHECNEFCDKLELQPHEAQENRGFDLAAMKQVLPSYKIEDEFVRCTNPLCTGNSSGREWCAGCAELDKAIIS